MHPPRSPAGAARIFAAAAGDAVIACATVLAIVEIRRHVDVPLTQTLLPPGKFPLDAVNLLVFGGSAVVALALSGYYDFRISRRHRPSLAVALPLQMAIVAILGILLVRPWPRTVFIAVPLLEAGALTLWRAALGRVWRLRPVSTLLIGEPGLIARFLNEPLSWLHVTGIVSTAQPIADDRFLGSLRSEEARAAVSDADEVLDLGGSDAAERRLELLELRGPRGYLFAPLLDDALLSGASFGIIGDHLIARVWMPGGYGPGAFVKRAADLVAGSLLLVIASPLLALTAAAVLIDSGRPLFLRQERVGMRGRTFGMWKLRTMHREAGTSALASDRDERVTRAGRWLRRYRLDELPQLVNVLRGEMSLVGPRPETPERTRAIAAAMPHFGLRLFVRPGIAGLAQTSAEYDQSPEVKLMYDLQYLCSWTLTTDLAVLFRAISAVLSGRGV